MQYTFRPQTNERDELEMLTALMRRVWPNNARFNIAYLEWLYCDNPHGRAIGFKAFFGDNSRSLCCNTF